MLVVAAHRFDTEVKLSILPQILATIRPQTSPPRIGFGTIRQLSGIGKAKKAAWLTAAHENAAKSLT